MKSLTGSGVTHLWTKIVEYVTGLGYTSNTGTVTGVTMNSGSTISPDANGVVDLGTVLTSAPVTSVNGQTGAVSLSIPTVPSNIVTGTSSSYTIWVGTQAQYEAISTKDATTIYLITES